MSTTLPKNEQGLRFGYTTGSCATAAAAATPLMAWPNLENLNFFIIVMWFMIMLNFV